MSEEGDMAVVMKEEQETAGRNDGGTRGILKAGTREAALALDMKERAHINLTTVYRWVT